MNFSNVFSLLQQRAKAVLAAVGGAIVCCLMGAVLTFVVAPGQALKAYQISRLPVMGAATVAEAAEGEVILITGRLANNGIALANTKFVAYEEDEWQVSNPTPDSKGKRKEPQGSWKSVKTVAPALKLDMNGTVITLRQAASVQLAGELHESVTRGTGPRTAEYQGKELPSGSRRLRGFFDGDLTTVYGRKEAGGVVPEDLFAGDRAAFEKYQQQTAILMLAVGLCFMALAPVVLVGGVVGAIFGKRK